MNNEKIKNKKLLILGASANELSLVERCKELGVYSIVTDYNINHTLSPAKKYADEYWDISWSDIDSLYKKAKEIKVDGVIAGYSEFRVENCIKLCSRLGLPCYITEEQLEITRDKIKFKQECKRNGVKVIKEYEKIDDVDSFPVIVKPTDRAGSIGISIANNKEDLIKSYKEAMDASASKNVIIEEFVCDANKFDAYYAIVNNEIMLLSTDDVINAKNNGFEKVIQSAWILPSKKMTQFENSQEDKALRKMIHNMGIKDGYLFFSGFARKEEFVFFECGFRLCGGYLFNYFPLIGKIDNLNLFIFHALTGSAECIKEDIKPGANILNVTINLYAKKGIISRIEGFDKASSLPTLKFVLQTAYLGQKCTDDEAILTKIGMAYFCSKNLEEIIKDVESFYSTIEVLDENNNDMIFDRVESDVIRNMVY